jgi:hypothetical protein
VSEIESFSNFYSLEISQEKRRQVIEEYKIKRDSAQIFKKICDQCFREVQVISRSMIN